VWAEDRLALDPDALWGVRRRGPFTSTCALARNEIRRVFIHPPNTALMLQTSADVNELTDADKQAELAWLKEQLARSRRFGRFAFRLMDRLGRISRVVCRGAGGGAHGRVLGLHRPRGANRDSAGV
jgi:hypothetical protein